MSSSHSLIWRLLELWRTLLSYRKKAFALRSYKTNYSLLQILQILNYQNQHIRKERLHNWYPIGKILTECLYTDWPGKLSIGKSSKGKSEAFSLPWIYGGTLSIHTPDSSLFINDTYVKLRADSELTKKLKQWDLQNKHPYQKNSSLELLF